MDDKYLTGASRDPPNWCFPLACRLHVNIPCKNQNFVEFMAQNKMKYPPTLSVVLVRYIYSARLNAEPTPKISVCLGNFLSVSGGGEPLTKHYIFSSAEKIWRRVYVSTTSPLRFTFLGRSRLMFYTRERFNSVSAYGPGHTYLQLYSPIKYVF